MSSGLSLRSILHVHVMGLCFDILPRSTFAAMLSNRRAACYKASCTSRLVETELIQTRHTQRVSARSLDAELRPCSIDFEVLSFVEAAPFLASIRPASLAVLKISHKHGEFALSRCEC